MRLEPAILRLVFVVVLLAPRAIAQAQFEWLATHDGGHGQLSDYGTCAAADSAGNAFLVSKVQLIPGPDNCNVDIDKYSASGVPQWTRNFDVPWSTHDVAGAAAVASNGDLCVVGTSSVSSGSPLSELFLLRYDANGNLLWSLTYGGAAGSGADTGRALAFDVAGNLIVAGTVTDANGQTDMLVKAFTSVGTPLWETRVNGPQNGIDEAYDLRIDAAGSIFICGVVDSNGMRESAVAKLDAAGQFQWLCRVNLSIPSSNRERLTRLAFDDQGGVIAVGNADFNSAFPPTTYTFGTAVRVSGNGNLLWSKTYGAWNYCRGIDALVDDHAVVNVLFFNDYLTPIPTSVVQRFSIGGTLLSTQTYDGLLHQGASPGMFLRGAAGQIYIAGTESLAAGSANYLAFLSQQDSSGATNWVHTQTGAGFGSAITFMCAAPGNRVVLVGTACGANSDLDALLMQFDVSEAPQTYCTAKLNSLGCTPRIEFSGVSSAAANSGFALSADRVRNNKPGLILYSASGAAATPFGGGLLCLAAPVRRTPASNSNGNPLPANDCSGVYSIDMNAFAAGNLGGSPIAALRSPGTAIYTQLWGRDPGFSAPSNVTLTNALRYVVLP